MHLTVLPVSAAWRDWVGGGGSDLLSAMAADWLPARKTQVS